jgi:hypothetical protein
MPQQRLTDRSLAPYITGDTLIHIVNTGDTSQYFGGSSYKATIDQISNYYLNNYDVYITGTTFDSNQAIVTRNDGLDVFKLSGGSNVTLTNPSTNQILIDVTIPPNTNTFVYSGNADVATSTLTFLNTTGGTFTVTNSAALFADNDINVTGGTYNPSTGCVTFTTNSGTTFDVCGFLTGFTDTNFANTDLTFDGNRAHDTNGFNYQLTSDGGLFAEGWQTLSQFDSSIGWGGQYIYTNSNDIRFYILNNETVRINNSGNVGIGTTSPSEKLEVSGNTKISGSLNIGNILGNTPIGNLGFDSSGNVVTGTTGSVSDIFVTGGTFDNNTDTITFTNTSGGTFDVTGITDTFVIAGTFNDTTNTLSLLRNDGNFVNITGVTDTFTGNTSGDCITDLYVTNLYGCSPLHIDPSGLNNVYIVENGGNVGIGTTATTVTLDVAGETRLSGSGQNVLTIIGSGDTQPLFTVQGSSGELFSVTDSLVGSLFSVNDISGLPILEVFDDDTIYMGNYQAPSLNTTVLLNPGTGLSDVYSIPVSAYTGAFFDYTVLNTTGARAGNIMSIFSGSTVEFSETTTNDIGSTSDVTFTMSNDGSNATLQVSATTTGWEVKTIVRSI